VPFYPEISALNPEPRHFRPKLSDFWWKLEIWQPCVKLLFKLSVVTLCICI